MKTFSGNKKSRRKQARSKTIDFFAAGGDETKVPSVGGLVVSQPHSQFLLPAEVVLFEPSHTEIWRGGRPAQSGKPGTRLIFLNTKLTEVELQGLKSLHEELKKENLITTVGDDRLPPYVRLHALRILQQAKFNVSKALDMMNTHLECRVRNLPIKDEAILADLRKGFLYWHGRDRKCRPLLVWRMAKASLFEPEAATRVILFVLEYAVRYLLVPGRVENWVLIIDLDGCGMGLMNANFKHVASNITKLLEVVYCGRNICTKIINIHWMIKTIVNGFIPADKKEKVQFVGDFAEIKKVMLDMFEPHQVEKRFGGTAPDLAPEDTYPFNFFPNATGKSADSKSFHEVTDRHFHKGYLWDESSPALIEHWAQKAKEQSLTQEAATSLEGILSSTPSGRESIKPCRDVDHWTALVKPKPEVEHPKDATASVESVQSVQYSGTNKEQMTCTVPAEELTTAEPIEQTEKPDHSDPVQSPSVTDENGLKIIVSDSSVTDANGEIKSQMPIENQDLKKAIACEEGGDEVETRLVEPTAEKIQAERIQVEPKAVDSVDNHCSWNNCCLARTPAPTEIDLYSIPSRV